MLHILAHCHGLLAKREKNLTKWASSFCLNSGDHEYAPMQFHFNFQESKWETVRVCVCVCVWYPWYVMGILSCQRSHNILNTSPLKITNFINLILIIISFKIILANMSYKGKCSTYKTKYKWEKKHILT